MVALFSYAYYSSLNEDRYIAVLVPPFAIAGVLAVCRRPPPVWAVLVSGLITARLVATSYAWPGQGPFDFFLAPSSLYFERIVVGDLAGRLPFSSSHFPTLALLAAAAAALLVVVVARRPGARGTVGLAAAGVVVAGVLAFQVSAAEYPARKFTEAAGLPNVADSDLSFVDRAAGGGHVEPLAVDDALPPELSGQLVLLRAYNETLGRGMTVLRRPLPPDLALVHASRARVDWRTGDTELTGPAPDLVLEATGFEAVRFQGEELPPPQLFTALRLRRVRQPLRALWVIRGDSSEGFPEEGRPLRLRVFPPAGGPTCVAGAVAVHALADRPSRYRISGAGRPVRGKAAYGTPGAFRVRVPGGHPTTLTLRGGAARLPDGRELGPTFTGLRVAACD
jgi:hypothetical protein